MTTTKGSKWSARKANIFHSVFHTDISQPTPYATPLPAFTQQGQPFGGPLAAFPGPGLPHGLGLMPGAGAGAGPAVPPFSSSPPSFLDAGEDQVRWDRAWHVVTSRIQLPHSVAAEDSFGAVPPESQDAASDGLFHDALQVVLRPEKRAPRATHTEDLLAWHTQQVRWHFVQHVLPLLSACEAGADGPEQVLLGCIRTLEAAHRQYLYGLSLVVRGLESGEESDQAVRRFRRDLHAIVGNSMSRTLVAAVRAVLGRLMRTLLRVTPGTARQRQSRRASTAAAAEQQVSRARQELLQLVESLHKVGLAGETFQVLFAGMMDQMMEEYIKAIYSGVWTKPPPGSGASTNPSKSGPVSQSINELSEWVEDHYARLAVEVFARIGSGSIAWADVERWKEIAVGRLMALRIDELFAIVLRWPESKGGLDDLRATVTTPHRRLQLTDAFSAVLQRRLLHPGRSTLDILQVYISMIRTFHYLDHSKVLLDRVAHSLQLYLCQRDDAVRIVVSGLLSNPDDKRRSAAAAGMAATAGTATAREGELLELAALLNDPAQQQRRRPTDDDELDWNDMDWVPAPVDAGVNYKRPKSEDVIGTLISALGSQDVFIKEFQNMVAERLLSTRREFHQELKVLSLLKRRFGEAPLQNCDVMIKDIQDSRKVDAIIVRNMRWPAPVTVPDPTLRVYHAKILSRLFWPSLPREHFVVPAPVGQVRAEYERGYEQLKSSRRLTWLDQLGRAAVRLDLEDRTVDVECSPHEAAVIYAFHEDEGYAGPLPLRRTAAELWEMLQMDEDVLEAALRFWVERRVLRRTDDDAYFVIETLDGEEQGAGVGDEAASASAAAQDDAGSGTPSPRKQSARPATGEAGSGGLSPEERARRQVYWQFIVGMLTNSSPTMPLGQMAMMMKMLIVDGFPWSNEELQEFLTEKVAGEELEFVGGKYRLPKK